MTNLSEVDEATLASSLIDLLRERGLTLCSIESCTGGMVGSMITAVAGASDVYLGGWVTYSNEFKMRCVNVPAEILKSFGAVSAETARAMAAGAMKQSGSDAAISVTGIAGPGGGSPAKPVGTVFIGCGLREQNDDTSVLVRRFLFHGDRASVRQCSAATALRLMRFRLLDMPWETSLPGDPPGDATGHG